MTQVQLLPSTEWSQTSVWWRQANDAAMQTIEHLLISWHLTAQLHNSHFSLVIVMHVTFIYLFICLFVFAPPKAAGNWLSVISWKTSFEKSPDISQRGGKKTCLRPFIRDGLIDPQWGLWCAQEYVPATHYVALGAPARRGRPKLRGTAQNIKCAFDQHRCIKVLMQMSYNEATFQNKCVHYCNPPHTGGSM